jgi:hypothetical protein
MKKIFTLLAAAMAAVGSMAADYTDSLTVSVNGVSSEQHATVSVTKGDDGMMTFSLKNFTLVSDDTEMPIGNIVIDSLAPVATGTDTLLVCKRNITITDGDDASVGMWLGSMLGEVPINFVAKLANGRAYASISIYMETLQQNIDVTFGSGYQIPNSGFENYHAYSNIDEPLRWHSFATAGGFYANFVKGTAHTFKSTDVRPGSAGSTSLSVKATKVLTVVANGTVTTGRMIAGSMSATDVANHAELDMSKTEVDGNGNPYYVDMVGHPDSLAVWVKFSQGTAQKDHPYATVSAYITDGTYFQDPQDKAYTNIMAKAQNNKIATTGGEWKRIVIPFTYVDDNVNGKAILVTISTNADAGKGSNGDEILIDDLELIYNAELVNVALDGDQVTTELKGKGAFSVVTYGTDDNDHKVATIDVYSDDLKTHSTHIFDITAAGINGVKADSAVRQVYNLGGQRVNNMKAGEVYIVKQGGKTYKVLK